MLRVCGAYGEGGGGACTHTIEDLCARDVPWWFAGGHDREGEGKREEEEEGGREARQMSISMMRREERPHLGRE